MAARETSPQAEALGKAIRKRRRALGLTLVQVAEVTGLSHPFLSQLERGRTRGSMRSLFLVAEALGTSQQALLGQTVPTAGPADAGGAVLLTIDDDSAMPGESESGAARLLVEVPGQLAVTEFCIPPRGFGEFFVHQHQELLYVASGVVEVELGEVGDEPLVGRGPLVGQAPALERHTLRARDSLRWPGAVPHRWRAVGPDSAVLLLIHPFAAPDSHSS